MSSNVIVHSFLLCVYFISTPWLLLWKLSFLPTHPCPQNLLPSCFHVLSKQLSDTPSHRPLPIRFQLRDIEEFSSGRINDIWISVTLFIWINSLTHLWSHGLNHPRLSEPAKEWCRHSEPANKLSNARLSPTIWHFHLLLRLSNTTPRYHSRFVLMDSNTTASSALTRFEFDADHSTSHVQATRYNPTHSIDQLSFFNHSSSTNTTPMTLCTNTVEPNKMIAVLIIWFNDDIAIMRREGDIL